jgi:hypothetical protein
MSGMSPPLLSLFPPSQLFLFLLPIQPSSSAQPLEWPYLSPPRSQARCEDDADIPGKVAEGKQYHKAQGKYSLEGALLLKTHAAQQKLKEKEKGVDPLAG